MFVINFPDVKRFLLIYFFYSCCALTVAAQAYQQRIDSFQRLLTKAVSDTDRIRLMGELSGNYMNMGKSAEAYDFGVRALRLGRLVPYTYYKALAHYRMGYVYLMQAVNDSAIAQYESARLLLSPDSLSPAAGSLYLKCNNNIAFAYANDGYSEKAMELIIGSLPLILALKDTFMYAATVHNVAAGLTNTNEYTKAYPYSQEDLRYMQLKGRPEEIAESFLSGALLMLYMDSLDRGERYLDTAAMHLKALGANVLWGRYYSYQSRYHTAKGRLESAAIACHKAFEELKQFDRRTNQYDAYTAQKELQEARGDYRAARAAAAKNYEMALEDEASSFVLSSLEAMASYSRKTGDLRQAYDDLEKYVHFKDSIDKKQTAFKLKEMEAKLQAARKEQQIASLQGRARLQRYLLWGVSILLWLTVLFFLYVIRQRKIRMGQKIRVIEQARQMEITDALLKGEERERTRLARDLHDGLGGTLAGLKLHLGRMAQSSETQQGALRLAAEQLGTSVHELRRIARNMMPESLLKLGLEPALKDLCENMLSPQLHVVFNAYNIRQDIPPRIQTMIYRIVQELLHNAARHSGAGKVLLQCSQEAAMFFITVEDNGKGFNTGHHHKGIGLSSVRSRVELLRGNMQIDSGENGTIINIELYVTDSHRG
ncbi:Histidine kinase-, DNA gyrase B-, and HSP90-like ATPase [Chitinophaga eiseniae]|uniref:histidine kinase n=1 Tax=Chitinophaga eiseniae TaxID=634771 RepID=A0A1T4TBV0_9BACT|nr:Histidine kinase-, DNA gyrase B-, and HSP90-like ATPase [Chitinophaga eiseniae]